MTASETVRGVGGLFEAFAPIDLTSVMDAASLQQRFDTKYIVPVGHLAQALRVLGSQVQVLEIDGRRTLPYRTVYFDTPDLVTYRAHLQRRRLRYKVRTRTYADRSTMLEVKTKDKSGRTIKHRRQHPGTAPDVLNDAALAYVADQLLDAYGFALPPNLTVSAQTHYSRATLVDVALGERITVDLNLRVSQRGHAYEFHGDYALLETKTPTRVGTIDRVLRTAGMRPAKVSKYALGIAVLNPHLPSNPWRPALRALTPAV